MAKTIQTNILLGGKVSPSFRQAFKFAQSESGKTATKMSKLGKVSDSVNSSVARLGGTIAAVLSVQKIFDTADAWLTVRSRVGLVTDGIHQQRESLESLYAISQKTRQSYEATGDLYAKIAMNAEQLNLANSDALQITETVNKALRVGGGAAAQNEAAILQFSQALASGRLQGDELRSLLENAPRLTKALAEGLGVATGSLKEMGKEGILTSDVIIKALQSQSVVIDEEFAKMPITIRGAFTYAGNAFGKFIDGVGQKTDVFSRIAEGIIWGTDKLFNSLETVGENKSFQAVVDYLKPFIPIAIKVGQIFADIGKTVYKTVLPVLSLLIEKIKPVALQIATAMLPMWQKFSDALKAISPVVRFVGKYLVYFLAGAFEAIWPIIQNAQGILGGLLDFITGVFTLNWSKAWEGVKAVFGNIFAGIGNLLLLPLKAMIVGVNSTIQSINGVKMPDWLGGKTLAIPLIPLPKFAKGGLANRASIFGEAGLEMAIPIKPRSPRSLALLNKTAQLLGVGGGSGPVSITYAPTIYGGDTAEIKKALDDERKKFEDWVEDFFGEQRRVAFG